MVSCIPIVLAAGNGRRMRSQVPKVLHQFAGETLLNRVLSSVEQLNAECCCVVVNSAVQDQIKKNDYSRQIVWIEQQEALGTGHAVTACLDALPAQGSVLIIYADVPLIQTSTLKQLMQQSSENSLVLLNAQVDDPTGYGRILRNDQDEVLAIVEHADASEQQRCIQEIYSGFCTIPIHFLKKSLASLQQTNQQQEYYLTDIIAYAVKHGLNISTIMADSQLEIQGVNTRVSLSQLERAYQYQQAINYMQAGVQISDPHRFDVRGTLEHGIDVSIDINVIIEGTVTLQNNVSIGPGCLIKDCTIASNVEIKAYSVIDGAYISEQSSIGPFARIRPKTHIDSQASVGNFVEVKQSHIGQSSKVNHMSYIGDTTIGKSVNIGAGTVTCNYDGLTKHKSTIGDRAFIGSNTSLVAPVDIGEASAVAAGSTITKSIASNTFSVERSKQKTFPAKKFQKLFNAEE